MADTNQNPTTSNIPQGVNENGPKKQLFGGGEDVFKNLEKFEKISNPSGEAPDFDFEFVDDAIASPDNEGENDEKLSLQDAGLENIFEESASDKPNTDTAENEDINLDDSVALNNTHDNSSNINNNLDDMFENATIKASEQVNTQNENEDSTLLEDIPNIENDIPPFQNDDSYEEVKDKEQVQDNSLETKSNSENDEEASLEMKSQDDIVQEKFGEDEKSDETDNPTHEDVSDTEGKDDITKVQEDSVVMESEPNKEAKTILIEQFSDLYDFIGRILHLENKINKTENTEFEIVGNNTDKKTINYIISSEKTDDLPHIVIQKKEKNQTDDEETLHLLSFTTQEENKNLLVHVDDYLLYNEEEDLQDPMRQSQVSDKLKKFIFLCDEKVQELQAKWEEIKEEKAKKKAFRDIFRNF